MPAIVPIPELFNHNAARSGTKHGLRPRVTTSPMPDWAIGVIVAGGVVLLCSVASVVFVLRRRRQCRRTTPPPLQLRVRRAETPGRDIQEEAQRAVIIRKSLLSRSSTATLPGVGLQQQSQDAKAQIDEEHEAQQPSQQPVLTTAQFTTPGHADAAYDEDDEDEERQERGPNSEGPSVGLKDDWKEWEAGLRRARFIENMVHPSLQAHLALRQASDGA